jgi:NosR/NirI family transcriptional regulator, nitrous oxide reductase regulator
LAAQLYQIVFFVASRALLLGLLLCPFFSIAGELNRADIAKQFAAPLVVGEQDPVLKLWPVFKPSPEGKLVGSQLHAYAFEAVDVSPVPGYSGKVINMLITLDTKGNFVDVKLLSHQEPILLAQLATSSWSDLLISIVGCLYHKTFAF